MARIKTTQDVETDVLINCGRRCALCFGIRGDNSEKMGQIAHIDRDNQNSNYHNLAYLCQTCHTQYDAKYTAVKGFTPNELRQYNHLVRSEFGPNYIILNAFLNEYFHEFEIFEQYGMQFVDGIYFDRISFHRNLASEMIILQQNFGNQKIKNLIIEWSDAIQIIMNIYDQNHYGYDEKNNMLSFVKNEERHSAYQQKSKIVAEALEAARKARSELIINCRTYL